MMMRACGSLDGFSISNVPVKPGFGELPVALHSAAGNSEHMGRLLHRESAEKTEFDDAAAPLINRRQAFQRFIECDKIRASFRAECGYAIERYGKRATAPLLTLARACEVHKNSAHHFCRDCKKVSAILPIGIFPIHDAKEGLVHKGAGFQGVLLTLLRHEDSRQPLELSVNERGETLQRGLIARTPRPKQHGDIVLRSRFDGAGLR